MYLNSFVHGIHDMLNGCAQCAVRAAMCCASSDGSNLLEELGLHRGMR